MQELPSIEKFSLNNFTFSPINSSHKALIVSLYTNSKAMTFVEPVQSEQNAIKIHQSFVKKNTNRQSGFYTWAIQNEQLLPTNKSENIDINKYIGFVVLYTKIGAKPLTHPEIGIMLKPENSHCGYGTKIFTALITYVFKLLCCDAINIRFQPSHVAMQRMSKKLGFIFDEQQQSKEINFVHDEMRIETLFQQNWPS
ncbi:GNAT family N-acetyltransferase [Litorilituus lipolyticus]|uniref:N-acetyltransferase n=1 Tax=Litorilituus lipolyticus TaxID=2491017 RepID=A0A502KSS6_9GAMM|nr:GNAT family N-acetyltransferase [Litorilituus lipolyticus]TPH14642.1 N-acetyltransferase [Litorilituus lipolyticus]